MAHGEQPGGHRVPSPGALLPDAVIVPLDDTEPSGVLLPLARRLAERFSVPFHRVTVTSESGRRSGISWQAQPAERSMSNVGPAPLRTSRAARAATIQPPRRETAADRAHEHPDHVGLVFADGDVDLVLRGGRGASVLLAYLADKGRPLVCLAAGGHGPLPLRLAWSTTKRLVVEAPGPVLVTGQAADPGSVSGTPATLVLSVGLPLPVVAVETAAAWAQALGAHVEVVGSEARAVDAAIDRLKAHGVRGDGVVLVRASTASALLERTAGVDGPAVIFAPAAPGQPASQDAFHLLERSRWPILVGLGTTR